MHPNSLKKKIGSLFEWSIQKIPTNTIVESKKKKYTHSHVVSRKQRSNRDNAMVQQHQCRWKKTTVSCKSEIP